MCDSFQVACGAGIDNRVWTLRESNKDKQTAFIRIATALLDILADGHTPVSVATKCASVFEVREILPLRMRRFHRQEGPALQSI